MTSTPTPVNSPSTPAPPVQLNGHCSVIFNSNGVDVLYTYQSDAFQSLPLQAGAKWASLPKGVAVNGAKCVLGRWNNQDALIVVGGTTTDPAQKDYPGLQYFTFGNRNWASIPAGASVTQNRQMHSAAFLNSSNSLLVYSGFQDNSFKQSSETFTIVAEPPYNVQSHPAPAPAGMSPILLPWDQSHAVMLGGSKDNHQVWLFSKEQEWKQIGVNVPNDVTNMSAVQGAMLTGINNAKAIQLFNLRATPNTVIPIIISAAESGASGGNVQREVDLNNLPPYNGTASSIVERVGYSLAQSRSSGMVVASGGTGDAASPLVLFNQTSNGWIKAKDFFAGQSKDANNNLQSALTSVASSTATATTSDTLASSTSTTSTTPVSIASPSSTVATGGDGLSDSGRTILGGVLGGLAGAGALLIILLLCLRWRKQKRRSRAKLYHQENKDQMGFDDTDAVAGFKRSTSRVSKHSPKDPWQRMPTAQEKLGATISRPNLVYDSLSPTGIGSRDATKPSIPSTRTPTKPKSDDGWSQYFGKSGSSQGLMPEPEGRLRMDSASHHTEYTLSNYDVESHTASVYHDHDNDTTPLNPRSSGYPQSEESWEQSKLHPKHSRNPSSLYRPGSAISEESAGGGGPEESFLNSTSSVSARGERGGGGGGTQTWESLGPGDGTRSFDRRPTSSMYADSINFPHPGDKVHISGDEVGGAKKVSSNKTNPTTSKHPDNDDMSWLNLGR